ncbi:MAG: endonuclease/exonuclease/phosphatase family protein [Microcoleus sp.]
MFEQIIPNFPKVVILAMSIVKLLLIVLAILVGIATILGFAGNLWWRFETLDHLRLQYSSILAIALAIGIIFGPKWSFIWGVPLALNLVTIAPLFVPQFLPNPPNSPTLTILHANLDRNNVELDRAIEYLNAQKADIIFLQEVTSAWLNKLKSGIKNYQIYVAVPLENSLGIAMLLPTSEQQSVEIIEHQILYMPSYSPRPMLEVIVRKHNQEIAILSTSTVRPTNSKSASEYQTAEFDEIAKWSIKQQQEQKREVIAIGDLNCTSWSNRFRQFAKDSNLVNSQLGFGLQTTWPANLPGLLRIPIDHCLHSRSIRTVERVIGSDIGSDHLPLLVKLL